MPLDKMLDSEQFVLTHNSTVLHTRGQPVACIIDENEQASTYLSLSDELTLTAGLTAFLTKHDDLVLLMGFKLQIQTDSEIFDYTVYPNEEFNDTVIFNESISIINKKMENLFTLRKIVTDQFVKTRAEYDKFKKMIS